MRIIKILLLLSVVVAVVEEHQNDMDILLVLGLVERGHYLAFRVDGRFFIQ